MRLESGRGNAQSTAPAEEKRENPEKILRKRETAVLGKMPVNGEKNGEETSEIWLDFGEIADIIKGGI